MSDWKVGDRVQVEKDGQYRVGAVSAVETEQVERTRRDWYGSRKEEKYTELVIKSLSVKWDDGEEQAGLSRWDVHAEDTDVEREFRLAVDDAHARIYAKLHEAEKLLDEAVAISEETGIPFSAGISPLSQSYLPNSLHSKFPDIDRSFANEIADASGEYEGWQHSAVC